MGADGLGSSSFPLRGPHPPQASCLQLLAAAAVFDSSFLEKRKGARKLSPELLLGISWGMLQGFNQGLHLGWLPHLSSPQVNQSLRGLRKKQKMW